MPYEANEACRHKIPRARYKVVNWPEYDGALQQRGSLTVWVTPEALAAWHPPHTGQRGRPRLLGRGDRDRSLAAPRLWSSMAAGRRPAALTRDPAGPWRRSARPHHVLPAQPWAGARRNAGQAQASDPVHVVIDATGLKVYGAGEWLVEKHGERGKRTWRKLHLAVDPSTGEILASELTSNDEGDASQVGLLLEQIPGTLASVTADGAYDGEPIYQAVAERQPAPPVTVVIPPRSTAVPSSDAGATPSQRDRHIQMIHAKGRLGWQKAVGYGRRSHAETAMFRCKAIIGSNLRARTLPAQRTETKVGCAMLNQMTSLGMPMSQRAC